MRPLIHYVGIAIAAIVLSQVAQDRATWGVIITVGVLVGYDWINTFKTPGPK